MSLPLADQIKCVARELAMRKNVYRKRVAAGVMDQEHADQELAAMEAVMATLKASELHVLKGWAIRHADEKRWRTMDSIGLPCWTDDPAKAFVCRLKEHIEAYAADDDEDVRVVGVSW